MKLEVGMYIRFKDKNGVQYIRKIVDLPEDTRYGTIRIDKDSHNVCWVSKKNVLNASFSVTDLIELGDILLIKDFVNEISMVFIDIYYIQNENQLFNIKRYSEKNKNMKISKILTKEQFENMAYEVE